MAVSPWVIEHSNGVEPWEVSMVSGCLPPLTRRITSVKSLVCMARAAASGTTSNAGAW